jgi:pilus assembly protein Flp/PilA
MERIKQFFKDESGASAVEYGLLVALIAVGLIGAMTGLKDAISTAFSSASDSLNAAS